MENYYEVLQVSPSATKEIIDKAYKTLAKKYHPDANPVEKKQWAEENFKRINAAYEIISDDEKRKKYDEQLKRIKKQEDEERYKKLYEQNEALKRELNNLRAKQTVNVIPSNVQNNTDGVQETQPDFYEKLQRDIDRRVTQSVNKAYHDAYVQRMRQYGYRIRYKKTLKDRLKDLGAIIIALAIILLILTILWQFPEFRNYVESNPILQTIIKAFKSAIT